MKIVILDGAIENPGDLSWDGFSRLGELTVYGDTGRDEALILSRIGDAEIVMTNKTPLSAAVIAAAPNLKYIGLFATGYNVVDTAAARARGVPVTNIPGYGTEAVAQYTMALLLELCHHVGHHDRQVHQGRWSGSEWCFWDYPLIELPGKTFGIIGLGRIGKAAARRAAAFGMDVIACSPHESDEGRALARYVDMDTLLESSDIISLHCPLFPETKNLINAAAIEKMKPGVMLLNVSRGQLVDEAALAAALESGKVACAAVDVTAVEPVPPDSPLLSAKNCIITPHIAWAALASRQRIMTAAVENLEAFLQGSPRNVVN